MKPQWEQLLEIARIQQGLFTTKQAAAAHYSDKHLSYHCKEGHLTRLRRNIYKIPYFPTEESQELMEIWLFFEQSARFSHQTALYAQQLADIFPRWIDITIPPIYKHKRIKYDDHWRMHISPIDPIQQEHIQQQIIWQNGIPFSSPFYAIYECISTHCDPMIIQSALHLAIQKGLLLDTEVTFLQTLQTLVQQGVALTENKYADT